MTVLVDTSAWIEFLRTTGSEHDRWLRQAIDSAVELAWTEPVMLELAMGVKSRTAATGIKRLLTRGPLLPVASLQDWEDAADLFRFARSRGRTIRSATDCLIATIALRTETPLLARDRDCRALAEVSDIHVIDP